jgi:hypothetical protein
MSASRLDAPGAPLYRLSVLPVSDAQRSLQSALGPRYTVEGEIARGGMATLFRAHDLQRKGPVVVKMMDPVIATAVGLKRFQNEIAIASALNHPSIVPLFDTGGDDFLLYYTMPLIAGESLQQRLERERQLPLRDALDIAIEVGEALAFAHAAGVIHRDIKPGNIMLASGRAMVTDFGIARAVSSAGDRVTSASIAVGTPLYMAPEQADRDERIDGRTDIYALGCVLFEMLAGEPPFTGRTAQAIIAQHQAERPPSLAVVRSSVPPALQQVIERALAKVPADRYATAAEFVADLERIRAGVLTGTLETPRSANAWRTATLLGAAAAVIAIGVWSFAFRNPPLSDSTVVVFPFTAPGAREADAVGEQVALMIGSALEHTEPLRWLDGHELIGRYGGGDPGRVSRRAGARYYVDGAVVSGRDSSTVIVRLHDAGGDSLVRQQSLNASAGSDVPQVALRAIGMLLPRLLPGNPTVNLSYLADRNPAAVADWLQGEREYAHARYGSAFLHMERALAKDSAMGVAALKGAQAAASLEDYAGARRLIDVAMRLDRQLPSHHKALARGLRFFLAGTPDSAITWFVAARRSDTTWSEPWSWLGETYYHLFPAADNPDSLAEVANEAALRLNPGFAPAIFHLSESAARRGDLSRARRLLESFRAVSPDSDWTRQLELTVTCAAEGPGGIDWAAAVRRMSERVVNIASILGAGGAYPACSASAAEAVLAYDTDTTSDHAIYRWSALKARNYQLMMEGRDDRIAPLLDSALARGIYAAPSLYIFNAATGSKSSHAPGAAALASLKKKPVTTMNAVRLRYVSLWASYIKDAATLDSVVRRSAFIADSTHSASDRLLADGATARLALLRGDTVSALGSLRHARPSSPWGPVNWDLWESAAPERILLAEVLEARGDALGAIREARLFDSPRSQIHQLFLRRSLEIRIRAAERLGLTNERSEASRRLTRLGR